MTSIQNRFERHRNLAEHLKMVDWDPHKFVEQLSRSVGEHAIVEDFVIAAAGGCAEVVVALRERINGMEGIDDKWRETMSQATERIVLTGIVGTTFGRVARRPECANSCADLFLDQVNRLLVAEPKSTPPAQRSEIEVASLREVAGFDGVVRHAELKKESRK